MRPATPEEEEAVRADLDAIEAGLFERILDGRRLAVWDDGRVGLVSPAVLQLPGALLDGAVGGMPAFVLGEGLQLDLQGARELARHTTKQTVRVGEKAARLFLYHRNILGDSVLSADRSLRPGDHCVVSGPRGEALGIGLVVGRFKGSREAVRPLHDLGVYLRGQDD